MIVTYKKANIKLPDFLIVGAAKSGTTSLYHYLRGHPQIFMPENKEPWFFSFMGNDTSFESPDPLNGIIHEISTYAELFENASTHQIIGEASPSYLYTYETAIENIQQLYQEKSTKLKIVIILRTPSERAFSQYKHFKKNCQEPLSFAKAIQQNVIKERLNNNWSIFYDYIGFGLYYKQVKAYLDNFDKVKIIFFEDFKNNTEQVVKDLLQFLGADEQIVPDNIGEQYNVSRVLRTDTLTPLYRFLFFGNNKFKKMVANLLPKSLKDKTEALIRQILLKQKTIPAKEKKKLESLYETDYKKLVELIDSTNQ